MPLHHDEDVIVHVDNVTLSNLFYDSEKYNGSPKEKVSRDWLIPQDSENKPSKPLTKKKLH